MSWPALISQIMISMDDGYTVEFFKPDEKTISIRTMVITAGNLVQDKQYVRMDEYMLEQSILHKIIESRARLNFRLKGE